jgi:hypothetical protein
MSSRHADSHATTRCRLAGVGFAASVLLTACGSTVTTTPASTSGEPGTLAQGSAQAEAAAGTGGLGPQPPAQSRAGSTAPGTTPSQPDSPQLPAGGAPNTGSAAGVRVGPGVKTKTIDIGLTFQDNNATASSIASAYNVQLADNRGAYEALIRYINTHGGVAGRQLRPTYYTYDPTSGTGDQIGQAACAHFTEDADVFAALDPLSGSRAFDSCMQRRGRVMVEYGLYFGSRPRWETYPNQVAADGLPFDDGGRILAESLASTGFLTSTTPLGAVVRSSADLTYAYKNGFVPALAKRGLRVSQTQYIRDAQSSSDISGYTADISSAVLKFRSSGINRVVFFDTGSYAALVFSQNAEQQSYHPRYGFSSLNSIVALQGSGSAAPKQQMVGAQGVSWETHADGLSKARTRSAQQCIDILKAAGVIASDAGTEASYLKTCQTFFLFKAAADSAGRDLNRDTFVAAVERLGSSFVATNSWNGATRFGARDHSGVSVFRPFAYREACSCFVPSGGVQPVDAS